MLELFSLFLSVFLNVFVTTNFIGTVPIFLSLTKNDTPAERRHIAHIASLTATVIILGFTFFGKVLMEFLGISFSSFQVAGGIILFIVALEMIFTFQKIGETVEKKDVAVCPLGIPLLAGAGVISLSIVFFQNAVGINEKGVVVGAILFAMFLGWLILLLSEKFLSLLGKEGIKALEKISGIFLAAIAMQLILSVLKG